jgi:hypothetical protein
MASEFALDGRPTTASLVKLSKHFAAFPTLLRNREDINGVSNYPREQRTEAHELLGVVSGKSSSGRRPLQRYVDRVQQ